MYQKQCFFVNYHSISFRVALKKLDLQSQVVKPINARWTVCFNFRPFHIFLAKFYIWIFNANAHDRQPVTHNLVDHFNQTTQGQLNRRTYKMMKQLSCFDLSSISLMRVCDDYCQTIVYANSLHFSRLKHNVMN